MKAKPYVLAMALAGTVAAVYARKPNKEGFFVITGSRKRHDW